MIPGDKACYPGTDVLVNKFDVRDVDAARAIEYKFASVRELELAVSPIKGKFDFEHLQAIHEHVFQDMYEWAGQTRKVDFAKRNKQTGMVNRFVPEFVMDVKVEDFNKYVADNNQLKNLTKPEFVKAITEVHSMLNELHPFREGNGRSTRIFLTQLAQEAGYDLNLEKIDKDRWNLASHRAQVQHDPKNPDNRLQPNRMDMRSIFHESLRPSLAHVFEHETRENAVKMYPGLKPAFERLDAIGKHAAASLNPEAAARVVDAEKARIGAKLYATGELERKDGMAGRLQDEKTKLGGGRTDQPDGYEVVASVLVDVLKQKGLSPAAIEKTMANANQRLNRMREAGVAAPGFKDVEKPVSRDASRDALTRSVQPGQEKNGPAIER